MRSYKLGFKAPSSSKITAVTLSEYLLRLSKYSRYIKSVWQFMKQVIFLMGYLLGAPISNYQVNGMTKAVEFSPLADPNAGRQRAQLLGFDTTFKSNNDDEDINEFDGRRNESINSKPYFSEGGRGEQALSRSVFRESDRDRFEMSKLPEKYNVKEVWPFRGIDSRTLDLLTVISLSGIAAELLTFPSAEGGDADINQLKSFLLNSNDTLSDKELENRLRYGLSFAVTQLRLHLGVLDDLTAAIEANASVEKCINIIETSNNIPIELSIAEYETRRKANIIDNIGVLDRLLFRDSFHNGKDDEKNKPIFDIDGDQPFYLALAISIAFYIYAINGGISLH